MGTKSNLQSFGKDIITFVVLFTAFLISQKILAQGQHAPSALGCSETSTFVGKIDEAFVKFVRNQTVNSNICISIAGGLESSAFEAVELVETRSLSATVFGECTSACVDFLLPSLKKIVLQGEPSFMIHGNPAYREKLRGRFNALQIGSDANDKRLLEFCQVNAAKLKQIWMRKDVNEAKLEELTDILQPIELIERPNGCPTIRFQHDLLSLTHEDLTLVFGNKFSGNACADTDVCFEASIVAGANVGLQSIIKSPQ